VAAPSLSVPGKTVAMANPMFWFVRASDNQPLYSLSKVPDRDGLAALSEPANPCFLPVLNQIPGTGCDSSIVQHPIVDTVPGPTRADYTPFWEIVKVKVPDSYHLDDIKSRKTLDTAGFTYEYTHTVISCPVIDVSATRARTVTQTSNPNRFMARIRFWYRKQLGSCLLLEGGDQRAFGLMPGANQPSPFPLQMDQKGMLGVTEVVSTDVIVPQFPAPAAGGTPQPVLNNYIFAAMPGDSGGTYSPLQRLTIATVKNRPDGTAYKPGDYKSVMDVTGMPPTGAGINPSAGMTPSFSTLVILGFMPRTQTATPFPDCQMDGAACPPGLACDAFLFCSAIR